MVYCSAVDCKSNSSRRKEDVYISFYGLSRDIENAKRTTMSNFTKKESVNVCFLHFDESCFEIDLKVYITIRFFSPVFINKHRLKLSRNI